MLKNMFLKLLFYLVVFCYIENYSIVAFNAGQKIHVYKLHIETNVTNRYAQTKIISKMENYDVQARDAIFSVLIPDNAYITGFSMEIDHQWYKSYIQEKTENDVNIAEFRESSTVRNSNIFNVTVNLEYESIVTFELTYEQLLERKNETYEIITNINPEELVENLSIRSLPLRIVQDTLRARKDINKDETTGEKLANINKINKTATVVTLNPNKIFQKDLAKRFGDDEQHGIDGQFVVYYDVVREFEGGEILIQENYLIHFFSTQIIETKKVKPLKKKVIFILDTSGSMDGTRINELKKAMDSILSELREDDQFSIIVFNHEIRGIWKMGKGFVHNYPAESIIASSENIESAKQAIHTLTAWGGTNILLPLKTGLNMIKTKEHTDYQPYLIFLTDGEPNHGITDQNEIVSRITILNENKKIPILSLSFGKDAGRRFLDALSGKNYGFSRLILDGTDAHVQFEKIFAEVSTPLFNNIKFDYLTGAVNVTKYFNILFEGGEVYISAYMDKLINKPHVDANSASGQVRLSSKILKTSGNLKRVWAYVTLKQLIAQIYMELRSEDQKKVKAEAVRRALEYSFLTDVTSLVVVKPEPYSQEDFSTPVPQ